MNGTPDRDFEIFLVTAPGLESALAAEAKARGFKAPVAAKGGVTVRGGWPEVWRANLELRGPARVLVRIAGFRAMHLAQLDKRAHKVPWGEFLRADAPFRVEATCKASRIYHQGAAAQRIEKAIRDVVGSPVAAESELVVKARIDDDLCTVSIDTTGESLHKRGHKAAVAKAPMRENLAALFLRQCGYDGKEPVLDPMCGSGTFVIEAAEIAARLQPGRARRFAFEQLATFDNTAWQKLRAAGAARPCARASPAGASASSPTTPISPPPADYRSPRPSARSRTAASGSGSTRRRRCLEGRVNRPSVHPLSFLPASFEECPLWSQERTSGSADREIGQTSFA
jgi:putative N6-adenine-specific DNA methylase